MKISKGWFRVLVVITVIWVSLIGGLMLLEYFSHNPFDQFPDGREPSKYIFWRWSAIVLKSEQVRQFEPDLFRIVSWACIPTAFLWLLAWAVAWIHDGFTSKPNDI